MTSSDREPADLGATAGIPARISLRLHAVAPGPALPQVDGMLALLDGVERTRAARTADMATARSFVAGRYLLRLLAAGLLAVPAEDLVSHFTCPRCGPASRADHGRPAYLLDGHPVPLALSLSRAGDFALLGALDLRGITPAGSGGVAGAARLPSLGVDLAAVATMAFDGFDDVALAPDERLAVGRLPAADRDRVRARLWTRKEALVKALGTGFEESDPDAVGVLRDGRITDLRTVDGVALEPLGLAAAVAVVP